MISYFSLRHFMFKGTEDIMRRLYIILAILLLAGCTASGKLVTDRMYHDRTYSINVTFPENYEITPKGKNSTQRVEATGRIVVGQKTSVVAPTYVLSVYPKDVELDAFIDKIKDNHFDPRHYWLYEETLHKEVEYCNCPARLIYFTSESQSHSRVRSQNMGVNAFIQLDSHYLVVEYIAFMDWYNESEFRDVLTSIDLNQFLVVNL